MEKKKVLFLGIMHFFLDSYMGFFPIYLVIARLDPTKAALIITATAFAGNILQPFMGYTADRIRGKLPLFLGMIIASISMSMLGLSVHYTVLFFLMLFGRLGSSLFHPAGAHISSAVGAAKRDASFAIFITIGTIGFAVSQPIFSAFTHRFGTERSFILSIPTVLLAFSYLLFSNIKINSQEESLPFKKLKQLLFRQFRPILLLFLTMVFRTAFLYCMNSFLAKTFEEWGFRRHIYSSANTVFMLSGAGGILAAGFMATYVKPRKLLFLSLTGFFPFFLLFIYFGNLGKVLFTFTFLALSGFILHAGHGTNIVMGHRIAPEMVSTISGILMGFAWAAASFGPILCVLTSGIFPKIGNLTSGLLILSIFPLVASVLSLYISKELDGQSVYCK